jgi:cell division protein FtsI (penicillin-binding protein 3)
VVAFLTLWAVGIETRLVNLQVWQHDFLKGRADYQRDRMRDVLGRRGDILDRNGEILATSSQGHTVYVAASEIDKPPEEFAKELCAVELSGCDNISHLIERLRKGVFTYVERKTVSEEEVAAVRALELRGVGFEREPLRQYPNDQ